MHPWQETLLCLPRAHRATRFARWSLPIDDRSSHVKIGPAPAAQQSFIVDDRSSRVKAMRGPGAVTRAAPPGHRGCTPPAAPCAHPAPILRPSCAHPAPILRPSCGGDGRCAPHPPAAVLAGQHDPLAGPRCFIMIVRFSIEDRKRLAGGWTVFAISSLHIVDLDLGFAAAANRCRHSSRGRTRIPGSSRLPSRLGRSDVAVTHARRSRRHEIPLNRSIWRSALAARQYDGAVSGFGSCIRGKISYNYSPGEEIDGVHANAMAAAVCLMVRASQTRTFLAGAVASTSEPRVSGSTSTRLQLGHDRSHRSWHRADRYTVDLAS